MGFPDDLIFDPNKCPVGSIAKVDFDFISDCTICPSPDPVFDCPDLEIPPEFPIPVSPCPTLAAGAICDSSVELEVITFIPPLPPPPPGTSTVELECSTSVTSGVAQCGAQCNLSLDFMFGFAFDFVLVIPTPRGPRGFPGTGGACPIMTVTASTSVVCGAINEADVIVTVQRIPVPGDSSSVECSFLFEFDFIIPVCDFNLIAGSITTTTLSCTSDAFVDVSITNEGSCSCEATIDFDFHIPRGCPGSAGSDGSDGKDGSVGSQGPRGFPGSQGSQGPPGSDGDKYAIVPLNLPLPDGDISSAGYVGLICVEGPEVRFEDIITMPLDDELRRTPIDPRFIAICEAGSIKVVGIAPSHAVPVGARIEDGHVVLEAQSKYIPLNGGFVNLKISGVRKGRGGVRFPKFSQEETSRNTKFWESWNTPQWQKEDKKQRPSNG